jgi:hypothetical protein
MQLERCTRRAERPQELRSPARLIRQEIAERWRREREEYVKQKKRGR